MKDKKQEYEEGNSGELFVIPIALVLTYIFTEVINGVSNFYG